MTGFSPKFFFSLLKITTQIMKVSGQFKLRVVSHLVHSGYLKNLKISWYLSTTQDILNCFLKQVRVAFYSEKTRICHFTRRKLKKTSNLRNLEKRNLEKPVALNKIENWKNLDFLTILFFSVVKLWFDIKNLSYK